MNVLEPGHAYELSHLDGGNTQQLYFVNRNPGERSEGTQNQEVLRVLIDRVQFLEKQVHWDGNAKILHHLRMALVLHEARVLERKTEQGKILPENVAVAADGHYVLRHNVGANLRAEGPSS